MLDELIMFLHSRINRVGKPYMLPPGLKDEMKRDLDNEKVLTIRYIKSRISKLR